MSGLPIGLWRVFFLLSALTMLAGGPRHPRGTLLEMLSHPNWVPSHLLLLASFIFLSIGLVLFARSAPVRGRTGTALKLAIGGTVLQALEMAVHTAAVVDQPNLAAGNSTPVLTTHLWMSVLLYPTFGLTMAVFIVAATRDRLIGSIWFAWLGILGALAHGAAAPLVIAAEVQWAGILFPFLMGVAVWLILAALLPARTAATRAVSAVGP